MEVQEGLAAFACFEAAVQRAREDRADPEKRKVMATALAAVFEATGTTKPHTLPDMPNRTTVGRWLKGESIPHPNYIMLLKKTLFFVPPSEAIPDCTQMMALLQNPRYSPVIRFIANQGCAVSVDQAKLLLEIASKIPGTLTPEMMQGMLKLR